MTRKRANKGGRTAMADRAGFVANMFSEMPDKQFTLKGLSAASGSADKEGRAATAEILRTLIEQGFIDDCGRGRYCLSRKNMPHYEGTVEITGGGSIFVCNKEQLESDVFVNPRCSMHALDGDRVEVIITHKSRNGGLDGEITSILERSTRCYAGVARVEARAIYVLADSRRMPAEIYLSRKRYPDIQSGDKVAVRIAEWKEGQNSPTGELVDVLGKEGDNNAEMHAILLEYDLPYKFEADVEAAADAIPEIISEQEIRSRRDMRDTTTFTIDPADAKDFDDALSIKPIKEGLWEVGVHIADVTHYITPDSVLDNEAQERGTSVYLVDRTIPMLPERLSNGVCSLRPDEDKLCFSAVFDLTEDGKIQKEWFGRTVIRSNRRFAYEQAQEVIETGKGDLVEEITVLNRMAQTMRKERMRKGAIAFERREAKFNLDENGKPTGIYFKEAKEANKLIEEFMLLANRRVATFCSKAGGKERTMVYRVHDVPNEEKFEKFRTFILRFGHIFKAAKGAAVAKELNALLDEVKGKPEENVVSNLAIRSMAKACYTTDNVGHYGLAFPYYTHFTSPIRRYPDMMVHRLLQRYLDGKKSADKALYEQLCAHASEREIIAADAERASIKYKMVEFMSDKIGQEFDGHISGMSEWGIYVELDDSLIEGMMYLRDIPGDYYQFDENRYEIYGHRTNRTFVLGNPLRIRVKSADMRRRTLTFEIADLAVAEGDTGRAADAKPTDAATRKRTHRGGRKHNTSKA